MFNPDKLDTTIQVLRTKGLGVHADLVIQAQEEIKLLQSEPLPRTPIKNIDDLPMKPLLEEETDA